ncbi:MAG: HAD-IIA family hydrolase [Eubacteriales bacterium]|nr:HAD-IIA family hydrolase [Eubacteriales bacterium]
MSFANSAANLARLGQVKCFVLDMDGTFYLGERILEGSCEFLAFMRAHGRRVVFLTNNSSRDGQYYVQKLSRMGCQVPGEDVYTSGMATCQYLNAHYPGKKVCLLGNEHLQREFARAGVAMDFDHPDVVVIGFDTTLDYRKMQVVCDHVRAGLPYLATHPDFNCPTETGMMPDIGAIIAFIDASTGRQPDCIVGKPHSPIVSGLMELTGLAPEELCICGDRLYTDVATGVKNGILAVCVLSGEATQADIAASSVQPDLVFDKLIDMITYIKR